MSQTTSSRPRRVLIAVLALATVAVGVFAFLRVTGDDRSASLASPASTSAPTTTATPTPSETTPTPTSTPTPTPTPTPSCEGPNTINNLDGTIQDSLLPDCGSAPVSAEQEQKSGLGLGCGGGYPVILYKTTTSGSRTSICGVDSSGEKLRLVNKPDGGSTVDLKSDYDPQLDAFVARKDGTFYTVQAYDGSLLITKDGRTTVQKSDDDWISLDNEPDTD